MNGNIRSAVIAGVIAFVIYVVISVATGTGFGAAIGVGLIFLVGTALITFIVARIWGTMAGRNRSAS